MQAKKFLKLPDFSLTGKRKILFRGFPLFPGWLGALYKGVRSTCFTVKDIVKGSKRHELGDDNKIRRLVARSEYWQDVWMVEDPTTRDKHAVYVIYQDTARHGEQTRN